MTIKGLQYVISITLGFSIFHSRAIKQVNTHSNLTPVTFTHEKKHRCNSSNVTWKRRGEAQEGWRWVTVSSTAHWGAELPVIGIWQLIIMAFYVGFSVTGHWSTMWWRERKEEISCHKDRFGFRIHTVTVSWQWKGPGICVFVCEDLLPQRC